MSYQVLARKWRPRVFNEMVGQEHVLRALINALDHQRLHHAYLFAGTRGVGKTTVARIFAKCLNCDEGISSVPCGSCGSCREIDEGRFIDLIEVDAASRTKVEDTRELLDNVQYAPVRGRFKVYLIDEVHMLSNHSFNALLKTLEEPPPHVKFLLATTDPQKLPVTILSRCLQFNLKNLAPESIVEQLRHVLGAEKISSEEGALWSLASAADGSMRDALSLTDQAIAHGGGKLVDRDVSEMLGTVDRTVVLAICQALAIRDIATVLALVAQLAEHATDYTAALGEMLSIWHRVAIAQAIPEVQENPTADFATIAMLAQQLSAEDVQLFYQICLLGRRDLPFSADFRSGFEMVLLRLLAFQPVLDDQLPLSGSLESGRIPGSTAKTAAMATAPTVATAATEVAVSAKKSEASAPEVASTPIPKPFIEPITAADSERTELVIAAGVPVECSTRGETRGDTEASVAIDLGAGTIPLAAVRPEHWIGIFQALPIKGILHNVTANLVLLGIELEGACGRLRFCLDDQESALYEPAHQGKLATVLEHYFSHPVTVEITPGAVVGETPRAHRLRIEAERRAAAVQTLRDDPLVKQLVKRFDGRLLEHTVTPVDP